MVEKDDLVNVFTAYHETNAEVIKIALAAEGIDAVVDNVHQGGLTGTLPVHVLVRAADAERARELIDKIEHHEES